MNNAGKAALAGSIVLLFVFALAAGSMPAFGSPVMDAGGYVLGNCERETGAANAVCAVVLDYRGFDTLGEASILLAAVSGVALVLHPGERGRKGGAHAEVDAP